MSRKPKVGVYATCLNRKSWENASVSAIGFVENRSDLTIGRMRLSVDVLALAGMTVPAASLRSPLPLDRVSLRGK